MFGNRMVLRKIGCNIFQGYRHARVRRNGPCSNKNFRRSYTALPRLTPQEVRAFKLRLDSFFKSKCCAHAVFQVTNILQANEYTKEFNGLGSIKYYDSNQLASNNPIEDTRSEAQCLLTKGITKKQM